MNTRKSLQAILCAATAISALTCAALAPSLASNGGGTGTGPIGTGPIGKIALPDLAIPTMAAGYSWENVEWIYVANQGNKNADASTLGVTWTHGRFTSLFTFAVKSLVPGEGVWIKVELGWNYSQVAVGTHMKYIADYFNVVGESNENNNELDMDH